MVDLENAVLDCVAALASAAFAYGSRLVGTRLGTGNQLCTQTHL